MILVNGIRVEVERFSDGTKRIRKVLNNWDYYCINIDWRYEDDSELVTIMMLVMHLRDCCHDNHKIILNMPYVPNARMDRVNDTHEVFTLKYFASIINSLKFDEVRVYDCHSRVVNALIDRCVDFHPIVTDNIVDIIHDIIKSGVKREDIVVFFPDKGSMDRYSDIIAPGSDGVVYGEKVRDWNTTDIKEYKLLTTRNGSGESTMDGKTVIIIDDIISSGGTMVRAIDIIKNHAKSVYIYATHLENQFNNDTNELRKCVSQTTNTDGELLVKAIYTTNSIWKYGHIHVPQPVVVFDVVWHGNQMEQCFKRNDGYITIRPLVDNGTSESSYFVSNITYGDTSADAPVLDQVFENPIA